MSPWKSIYFGSVVLAVIIFSAISPAAIPQSERDALIALYNSTNGSGWTDKTNWLGPPGTENTWYGVTTDAGNTTVTSLHLAANNLVGTIPADVGNMTNLSTLSLNGNQLGGSIPAGLGSLANLQNLFLSFNQLSGSIPSQLGNLTNLQTLWLASNQLSGSIPSELGNLTNLEDLYLSSNELSGSIPSQLGSLTNLRYLELAENRLNGSIPSEIGNLPNLRILELSSNQLNGEIPTQLQNLTNLYAGNSEFRWNALHTSDPSLRAFLDSKQMGGNWESTQTIAPSGVAAGSPTSSSVLVSWTPIVYTGDTGGYRVHFSLAPGGPYTLFGTTPNKSATSLNVSGLNASTPYYFVVETLTNPHTFNQNTVISEQSSIAAASTTGGCTAPAITNHPQSITVTVGQTATLTVAATGTAPLSYQWYQGASGNTSIPVGANSSAFMTPPMVTPTDYWVRVTNACGQADSSTATVTVTAGCVPPSIAIHPLSQTIACGLTATLSVTANGTSPLHYQWYQGTTGDTTTPVGTDSTTFTTPALTSTTSYWARVTNECGGADTNAASITVLSSGPTIASITSKTSKPGKPATINGTGFSATKTQNSVKFGKSVATVKSATTTKLTVTIPTKCKSGKSYAVQVSVNGKKSNTVQFKVK